jgi:hypothetical protein
MSNRVIHFFKYLEYEELYNLGFKFESPVKNSLNTYIAKLKSPILFILPKSEILDINQDNFGINKFKYLINEEDHSEFLTFLDNLDSLCINVAAENSELWFKKKVDAKAVVKYYNNLYNNETDETGNILVCNFEISDNELLNDLSDYNDLDDTNLMVSIDGIEFYKQTFRWKISLDSVIETVDDDEDDDEDDEDNDDKEELNFENLLENKEKQQIDKVNNIKMEIKEKNKIDTVSELALEKQIKNSNKQTPTVINKEVIDELADFDTKSNLKRDIVSHRIDNKNLDTKSVMSQRVDIEKKNSSQETNISLKELESLILEKKKEHEKYTVNAERAKNAIDVLNKKVSIVNNELKKYQEKYNELSQTTSVLSQSSRKI